MKLLVYTFVLAICFYLLTPAEAAFFKDVGNFFKKAGEKIKDVGEDVGKAVVKGVKKAGEAVVDTAKDAGKKIANVFKPTCKVLAGLFCSKHVKKLPKKLRAVTFLTCKVSKLSKCNIGKREADVNWAWYPFSDDFDEYDDNDDDFIEYEEFAYDFLARFKMINPEELRIVFIDADEDGDGRLSKGEFLNASWDFGTYSRKVQKTSID